MVGTQNFNELQRKPLDRELLNRFAAESPDHWPQK